MHHPTDRIAHTTAFVTPVVEHWLEREIAQWVPTMKDRSDDPSHHERTLLPRSYLSLSLDLINLFTERSKTDICGRYHYPSICSKCLIKMRCLLLKQQLHNELTNRIGCRRVCNSHVSHNARSSLHYEKPIELFLVPASAPRMVYQRPWYVLSCLWDGAYKRTLAANR